MFKARSQLPEEIQPHLTHAFRLISEYLTDQLPKRLGVPHVQLHKQRGNPISHGNHLYEKVPYPIGFQILLLDVPGLRESSSERRADFGHDVFRCQRTSDVL